MMGFGLFFMLALIALPAIFVACLVAVLAGTLRVNKGK
jgi:hypothetical protein